MTVYKIDLKVFTLNLLFIITTLFSTNKIYHPL